MRKRELKDVQVWFRLTKSEAKALERRAVEANKTVAAFVAEIVLTTVNA